MMMVGALLMMMAMGVTVDGGGDDDNDNDVGIYALNTFDNVIFFYINETYLFYVAHISYIGHDIHKMNRGP